MNKINTLQEMLDMFRLEFPYSTFTDTSFGKPCCKNKECNISNTDDESTIEIDLPGYKKENIKILVEDKVLSVKVEGVRGNKTFKYTLTNAADASRVSSKLLDGVLTIIVPVKEEAKPKSFEVPVN